MPSEPLVLAFDTSAAHCAAALLCGGTLLDARAELMGRGQAERLVPLLEEILSGAGLGWSDLDRIGVGVGPGNFTGIRIAVSAARGLALGLGIPAIGVSGFEAIHLGSPQAVAVIRAPRDQAYVLAPGGTPSLVPHDPEAPGLAFLPGPTELAARIGLIAASKTQASRPAPLYIRPADAAPSREAPPVILDDA